MLNENVTIEKSILASSPQTLLTKDASIIQQKDQASSTQTLLVFKDANLIQQKDPPLAFFVPDSGKHFIDKPKAPLIPVVLPPSTLYIQDLSKFIKSKKEIENYELFDNAQHGLFNISAILLISLWYFFSFATLFLNKYILSYLGKDPALLGTSQMIITTVCGFIQMYIPCGLYRQIEREGKPPNFVINMIIVGSLRFTTVILGLVALKFVAISFTETIKSSAPIFTVLISRLVLSEKTGIFVNLSLIPVMGGLALCSSNEISFNTYGFLAAMATNITDCLQNVYSKMLISGEKFKYTPAELQFYTSLSSILFQIPVSVFFFDLIGSSLNLDHTMMVAYLLNGLIFHFQSIAAYVLMSYISPVTHSVANTAKRASLIWLSVLIFGNPITLLSGIGTLIVIIGVLLYNKAREYDVSRNNAQIHLNSDRISLEPLIEKKYTSDE